MTVTLGHIQAAEAILTRIAFSRGEGADPAATLEMWRKTEGFDEGVLEAAARESADGTLAEIEEALDDGEPFTTGLVRQFIEREYLTAAQIFWIVRARQDKAAEDDEAKIREAADA